MLCEYELNAIEFYAKLTSKMGLLGIDWNPKTRILEFSKTKLKNAMAWFQFLSGLFVFFFSCYCAKKVFGGNKSLLKLGLEAFFLVIPPAFLFVFSWNLMFQLRKEDLQQVFNQMLIFSRKKGLTKPLTKRAKYFGYVKWILLGVASPMIALICSAEHYFISKQGWNVWINGIIVGHVGVFLLQTVAFLGFLQAFLYHFYVLASDELSFDGSQRFQNLSHGRIGVHKAIQNYKILSILCTFFNLTFCKEILPLAQYVFALFGMVLFGLAIRLKPTEPTAIVFKVSCFFAALYVWGATILLANMLSSLWYSAKKYLFQLQFRSNLSASKCDGMIFKSIAPIRVNVGGLFDFEKEAKLTLVHFIVLGTVNMLLVLSNK